MGGNVLHEALQIVFGYTLLRHFWLGEKNLLMRHMPNDLK